jgi:hypothetical protein
MNSSPNTNTPNLLFFSNKCKTCSHFINVCHQNKLLKYFQLIDIDNKTKEMLDKGLKKVPTIIVKGINKPIEGKDVFVWLESVLIMNNKKNLEVVDQYLPEVGINNGNPGIRSNNLPIGITSQSNPTSGTGTINPNNNIVKRTITAPPIINKKDLVSNNSNSNSNPNQIKILNGVQINTSDTNSNGPSVKSQPFGYLQEEMSGFSDTFAYLLSDNPLPKCFLPHDKDLQIYTAPEGDKLDSKRQSMLIKNMEMIRENDKNMFVKQIEKEYEKIVGGNQN